MSRFCLSFVSVSLSAAGCGGSDHPAEVMTPLSLWTGTFLETGGHAADSVMFQMICITPKDVSSPLSLLCCSSLRHIFQDAPAIISCRMKWVEMSAQEIAPTSQTK